MIYTGALIITFLFWVRTTNITKNLALFLFFILTIKLLIVNFGLLDDKLAGARAFSNFSTGDYRLNTFFPTLLLNIPAFLMGSGEKSSALTNTLLSVITPVMAIQLFESKVIVLSKKLILFFLVPSVFLWGCFGLREYVIIFYIILAYNYYFRKRYLLATIFITLVIISRPEYGVFLPIIIILLTYRKVNSYLKLGLISIIPVLLVYGLSYLFEYAIQNFTSSDVNGLDLGLLEMLMDARFYRQFKSDGGSTAFYSISVYQKMTMTEKISSNIYNSILLFNSSSIRNIIIFGLDTSALLIFLLSFIDRRFLLSKSRFLAVLFLFMVLIVITSMVVNGGNAFRMRFVPLFFLGILFVMPFSYLGQTNLKNSRQSAESSAQ